MKEAFPPTSHAERITGLGGTGKTAELIARVQLLLNKGVKASDITVFCASPDACITFKQRLESVLSAPADGLHITTPRELALDILTKEEAVAFTGRKARLLADFEVNFLLEDMKTTGIRPRRLREILKFIYRGWTELSDEEEGWLITSEEELVHDLVKKNLALVESIIEPELANLTIKFLEQHPEILKELGIPHVFVDDYQYLSKASQVLMNQLATESITVAGHAKECVEVFESYPCVEGLDEFLSVNPHATDTQLTTCHLSKTTCQVANQILADESVECEETAAALENANEGNYIELSSEAYQTELESVADLVKDRIEDGMKPSDIFVIAPHRAWTGKIRTTLQDKGIDTTLRYDKQPLGGDIRDFQKSISLRIYTALRLAADPTDAASWRAWCGFGNHLANSAVFTDIRTYAEDNSCSLVDVLAGMDSGEIDISGAEKVLAAYNAAQALLKKVEGMSGEFLLMSLSSFISTESNAAFRIVSDLCEAAPEGDESADELIQKASRNLHFPCFDNSVDKVKVGTLHHFCGLNLRLVAFCGFVNGLFPDRNYLDDTITHYEKQRGLRAKNLQALYSAFTKASEEIVVSYFTKMDLESAEILKLEIERIRLENKVRMCTIEPSIYLSLLQR